MGLFRTDLVSVMAIITGGAISVVASGMLMLLLRVGDAPIPLAPPVPVVTYVPAPGIRDYSQRIWITPTPEDRVRARVRAPSVPPSPRWR